MKFGTLMENHMLMTVKRSKSKPEVEFQYGGCLLSETGSNNILVVGCDIWLRFCVPIALDVLKSQTWPNQKPEVDLQRYGRHVVKSI